MDLHCGELFACLSFQAVTKPLQRIVLSLNQRLRFHGSELLPPGSSRDVATRRQRRSQRRMT